MVLVHTHTCMHACTHAHTHRHTQTTTVLKIMIIPFISVHIHVCTHMYIYIYSVMFILFSALSLNHGVDVQDKFPLILLLRLMATSKLQSTNVMTVSCV